MHRISRNDASHQVYQLTPPRRDPLCSASARAATATGRLDRSTMLTAIIILATLVLLVATENEPPADPEEGRAAHAGLPAPRNRSDSSP
jgi:hypothetical protein